MFHRVSTHVIQVFTKLIFKLSGIKNNYPSGSFETSLLFSCIVGSSARLNVARHVKNVNIGSALGVSKSCVFISDLVKFQKIKMFDVTNHSKSSF